jgi:Mn-containing catalase
MFMEALDSIGKLTDPFFGTVDPDSTVDLTFNLSKGETSDRGPWNMPPNFEYIEDPKPQGDEPGDIVNPDDEKPLPLAAQ